jgi:hypothetical protein
MINSFVQESTTSLEIRKNIITLKVGKMDITDILFWKNNPRTHHLTREYGEDISQENLMQALVDIGEVDELAKRILNDGRINEPILVWENGFVVVEGNRRLAACKKIYEKYPTENWRYVPTQLISKETPIEIINMYLGDIHLIGKKDWKPYNQAAFLNDTKDARKINYKELATEFNMKEPDVKKKILTYKFMQEQKEFDPERYNYYECLFTNKELKEQMQAEPDFGTFIVKKVRSGEFKEARDVRDGVSKILKSKKDIKKRFLNEELPYKDAITIAKEKGVDNYELTKIRDFHGVLKEVDTKKHLKNLRGTNLDDAIFGLEKIASSSGSLLKMLKELKESLNN